MTQHALDPYVEISDLTKEFSSHRAVDNVSLSVRRGEVVSIIGPSGAGKSTFLRCINFLESPSCGDIRIGSESVRIERGDRSVPAASIRRIRRGTGMVFQAFNLYPHMSILKNVSLPQQRVLKATKQDADAYAMELLERVGLSDKANAYPAQCSGGQQQRVAIVRALALRPELMLFDEPTSALDPEVGAEILKIMKELVHQGLTMMVVTHEMEFARQVSDTVVVMVDGAVIESGHPSQVMDAPAHARTKQFLSAVLGR